MALNHTRRRNFLWLCLVTFNNPTEAASHFQLLNRGWKKSHLSHTYRSPERTGVRVIIVLERWLPLVEQFYCWSYRVKILKSPSFLTVEAMKSSWSLLKCLLKGLDLWDAAGVSTGQRSVLIPAGEMDQKQVTAPLSVWLQFYYNLHFLVTVSDEKFPRVNAENLRQLNFNSQCLIYTEKSFNLANTVNL